MSLSWLVWMLRFFVTVSHLCASFGTRAFLHFVCVSLCFMCSSEGRKEALPPFESVFGHSRKDGFLDFRCVHVGRESCVSLGWSLSAVFPVTDVLAHWVRCHIVGSHVACVVKRTFVRPIFRIL